MSKIAILGDLHWGARNDSKIFLEYFIDYFDNEFFPYLLENDIKLVFQLGDFVDRRKVINIETLKIIQQHFIPKFEEYGIKLVLFTGNHDIFHKNNSKINALDTLFSNEKNIRIIQKPIQIDIDGLNFDLIPWINTENYDSTMKFIDESTSNYCLGHFEIEGFEMNVGVTGHGGMNRKIFKHYDQVWSGHYHHHSEQGNITYTGTPYEITWHDYNDQKGFVVLDTKTKKKEFIKTKNNMFIKLYYESKDQADVKNKIVKLYHKTKRDQEFDKCLELLNNQNPHDLTIIDQSSYSDVEDENIEVEDTKDVILSYIKEIEGIDIKRMSVLVENIYNEAIDI